jgi:DNA replication initiation complex subunit (GINS family)
MKCDYSSETLALILDSLFAKINSFKTKEELSAYLKEELAKPKDVWKKDRLEDLEKAIQEVRTMLKRRC